jgi:hypothetical protein
MQFRHARGAIQRVPVAWDAVSPVLQRSGRRRGWTFGQVDLCGEHRSAARPRLHDQFSANHVEALSHAGKTQPLGAFAVVEAFASILDPEAQD